MENAYFETIRNLIGWTGWSLIWYLLLFSIVVIWLALVLWTLKDARRRIEDTLIIGVAVATSLVFPFIGTLVYTILRPSEYLIDVRERELEIQAMEQELRNVRVCPACREPVREDFLVCPKCRRVLRLSCATCERPLEFSWKVCPYCSQELSSRRMGPVGEVTELIGGEG